MLARRIPRRLVQLYVGLWLYGLACAFFVRSGLGLDPWDVLHQGISERVGLAIGTITIIVSGVVLLLWIPLKQWPGLGTISNALLVGFSVNVSLTMLPVHAPLWVRIAELLGGIVLLGMATGMYIGAGFGPGPRDGLMTGFARRTGRSIRLVRTLIERAHRYRGRGARGGLAARRHRRHRHRALRPAHRADHAGLPAAVRPVLREAGQSSSSSSRASQVAKRSTAVSNSG